MTKDETTELTKQKPKLRNFTIASSKEKITRQGQM